MRQIEMLRLGALVAVLSVQSASALSERPMAVDDAATLPRGGAKLEAGWSIDDEAGSAEFAAGYAPIEHLEFELGAARTRDAAPAPDEVAHAVGFVLKWVPLQAETGLSAGLKFSYERARGDVQERVQSLTGLLSWRFDSGVGLHLNAGRERVDPQGACADVYATWGVGADFPIAPRWQLTLETVGAEGSGPDRQVGVRYQLADGLKLSAAVGRGNRRSLANVGIAWEF